MLRVLGALVVLLLLAGCASTRGPDYYGTTRQTEQPADVARIYFVRPETSFMMAAEPIVVVNGRRVGTLRNGEAFYRDARPGRYEVYLTSSEDDVIELELAAGEQAYVRSDIEWRLLGFRLIAEPVEPEEGARLLAAVPLVTGLEADLQRADPEPLNIEPRPEI
jgi:hypothetical protein